MTDSRKEDLLTRATKLTGNAVLAKQLIADSNLIIDEFAKEHALLMKRTMNALIEKQASAMTDLSSEAKSSLKNLLSINSIEEIYSLLLLEAAEGAIVAQSKCSDFVYLATSIWEKVALSSVSRNLVDMILKNRPEPPKDKLS